MDRQIDHELNITTVTFNNGAVMHHKFLDQKKDQVLVEVMLPGGAIEESPETHGISSAASFIITRPATHRLNSTEIRDFFTGKNVSVSGSMGLDTLSLMINGSQSDLAAGLQLAHALLTDATLEESAMYTWRQQQLKAYESKLTQAQGQLSDAIAATIWAGDIRLAPLTPEIINKQDRAAAEAWFKRIASSAAIEVAVVGDMDVDKAIELIGQYIGSLPQRQGTLRSLDSLRTLKRDDGPFAKQINFKSVTPKAFAMAGFIGVDERDPDRRPLGLASLILTDRMIQRIRVQEQLVYSIRCSSSPGRALPGIGMFIVAAPTDPQHVQKLTDAVHEMILEFAKTGPSEEELVTAKKQIANQIKVQLEQPEFWLSHLGEVQYRQRRLDDLKEIPARYERMTREDLQAVVNKIAQPNRAIRLSAVPILTPTTSPAP